jgi:predicted nucleotidyltransferase
VLSEREKNAVEELGRVLRGKFSDRIKTILLYGSKVRGDNDVYSDIDLFILVDKEDKKLKDFSLEIAYELNLKYDVVLSIVICDQDKFASPIFKITPFFNNILRDGVKIESRA